MLKNNESKRPLISFVITCHNTSTAYLRECVDSIIKLSLREDEREILLIDDGSSKCLLSEIMDIADNVTYVRQKSGGYSSARNTGMRFASGKYIQFIYGGDKLLSEAYEHCIDIIRYNDPDIVMFNSGNESNEQNDYEGEEPSEGYEYMKRHSISTSPWGYVFSSRLIVNLSFDTELYAPEEEFTTLLLLGADKVYSSSAVAYFIREKADKVNRHDKKAVIKRLDDAETIIKRLQNLAATMAMNDRLALQRRVAQLAMNYIINTILWTRSSRQLETRLHHMEENGLFPLPNKSYSKKYILFNKLSRRSIIRKLVFKMLG